MARGNHVNSVNVIERFGLYIVSTVFPYETFKYYDKIYLSKTHRVIGRWKSMGTYYRDYMICLPTNAKLIRRSDNFLYFKPIV